MNAKQTLLKIFRKIKSFFRAVFKMSGWVKKIAWWIFKLSPSLKRKVFMAGAVCFYNRFVGKKKDRIKNRESGVENKK